MARGRHSALLISLTIAEQITLDVLLRRPTTLAGVARRARIVTLRHEGHSISDIHRLVGVSRRNVVKWLRRWQAQGLEGLRDKPGRGTWLRSTAP
jgi:hypothetical protein